VTTSGDLIREARLRSGLTQAELGRRLGKPQSTIARWESGAVRPSFETLREAIRACGLELDYHLVNYDDSYLAHINRQLDLSPAERVARMADVAAGMIELRQRMGRAA
jgi:transcriptional regulator with XRE-family HTH domain